MDRILLIDAMNAIWRASTVFGPQKSTHTMCSGCDNFGIWGSTSHPYHCVCGKEWDLLTDKCEATPNADFIVIFNFFRNLRPIIEDISPDKCFFVLEGHPQFRYDLYSEYKANRIIKEASKKETKEKLYRCKDEIVRLMQYLPITCCKAEAYEADDVVATLCENMKEEDITILSNDSDYIQLLQKGYKHCQIYNPIKKETMEAPPYPYVAWKCLVGDKADNIPALLKPKQVLRTLNDPGIFAQFMAVEENRSRFNINRQFFRMEQRTFRHLKKNLPGWNLHRLLMTILGRSTQILLSA